MEVRQKPYSRKSTLDLIRLIVEASDRKALAELLKMRKPFRGGNKNLRLTEFVWELRQQLREKGGSKRSIDETADDSYSLTVAKFSALPASNVGFENTASVVDSVKSKQIDCRNYYRAVLDAVVNVQQAPQSISELGAERQTCATLQRLVLRHFFLSQKETRRQERSLETRYTWEVNGCRLTLWYPKEVPASALRSWLEQEYGEQPEISRLVGSRIQAAVYAQFGRPRWASIDAVPEAAELQGARVRDVSDHEAKGTALARAVADEKDGHFERLRPAIQKLGRVNLRQLILRCFDDLVDGVFVDQGIASDFGLSKATFSRFAGSNWQRDLTEGSQTYVPDLWHNTARVISSSQSFLEVAQTAGLLKTVERVAQARKVRSEK